MRHLLIVIALCAAACSDVGPPPLPSVAKPGVSASVKPEGFPSNYTIIFTREFGMWRFKECILEVASSEDLTNASIECQPTAGAPVNFSRRLSPLQSARLRQLVPAADLYGGAHIGFDHTPGDGTFDTLTFRPAAVGRSAVLVTSGNTSFVNHESRRGLLELLMDLCRDLLKEAGQPIS